MKFIGLAMEIAHGSCVIVVKHIEFALCCIIVMYWKHGCNGLKYVYMNALENDLECFGVLEIEWFML